MYHNAVAMTLPRHVTAEEETSLSEISGQIRTLRRVGVAMTLFAAVCVFVGLGALLGGKREVSALADSNVELAKRVNKLTAEVALKDARFQASKGVMESAGRLDDLLSIQAAVDRYALVELHNGNTQAKTADEVRREACDRLASVGFPCVP